MELDGILNACTRKVVPNSARMTVTTSDSKYSRVVDFGVACSEAASGSTGFSVSVFNLTLPQPPQSDLSGGLLGGFLALALGPGELFSPDP